MKKERAFRPPAFALIKPVCPVFLSFIAAIISTREDARKMKTRLMGRPPE
mgnify:CR=1 FL=1